jgi:hypothetical protein
MLLPTLLTTANKKPSLQAFLQYTRANGILPKLFLFPCLIPSPNVVWALVPAVGAAFENAVSTFKPVEKLRLLKTSTPTT